VKPCLRGTTCPSATDRFAVDAAAVIQRRRSASVRTEKMRPSEHLRHAATRSCCCRFPEAGPLLEARTNARNIQKESAPKRNRLLIGVISLGGVGRVAHYSTTTLLSDTFSQGPTHGPFTADGNCPVFRMTCRSCEVLFGNRGLSTLNSFYEIFMGEGAFEINGFEMESLPAGRFNINAQSNRGPIRSENYTDRLLRLGQDRENEVVYRTNQCASCDAARIYEHQAMYVDGDLNVQDLEFPTERDQLRFRLFQNGSPTADVVCLP